jgi:hypothetical protein
MDNTKVTLWDGSQKTVLFPVMLVYFLLHRVVSAIHKAI